MSGWPVATQHRQESNPGGVTQTPSPLPRLWRQCPPPTPTLSSTGCHMSCGGNPRNRHEMGAATQGQGLASMEQGAVGLLGVCGIDWRGAQRVSG